MTKKLFLCMLILLEFSLLIAQNRHDIADRRELFVDSFLIDKMENVTLKMHEPINRGPVLYFDKPWEGNFSGYCTIIEDKGKYKLYYRGVREALGDGEENEVTCLALSDDGINWTKPNLNLYTINKTRNNNVVLANEAPVTHNFSPFLDTNPKALKSQRYKAIGGIDKSGLIGYVSPDGIHWKRIQSEPIFRKGVFDSQNVVFWSESEQLYVCYFRTYTDGKFTSYKGIRTVSRAVSKDFIHWSEPEYMEFGNTPYEHLYTHQTSPYYRAPHIYLAIGARFMPKRKVISDADAKRIGVDPKYYNDCSDAVLLSSRGGNIYQRTFMSSFIRPGIGLENWVSRSNYPVLNIIQTSPTEMSVYMNENYAQTTAHIKRYTVRIDGISSANATYADGYILTKPIVFKGKELEINYSTSAAGSIKIELLNEDGSEILGFKQVDADIIIGNEIKRVVTWKGNKELASLAGKAVRLKIYMKDADLYSFKFN